MKKMIRKGLKTAFKHLIFFELENITLKLFEDCNSSTEAVSCIYYY